MRKVIAPRTKLQQDMLAMLLLFLLLVPSGALAVVLSGNVQITQNFTVGGSISKGGGSFAIDHPLDPENKLLFHSFVESPDAKNIYDGIAVLDANGEIVVQLPDYFMALNREFRYQLFPIGEPSPNLYIKEQIVENVFTIAGGNSGQRISWQVTGIRHDPFILENPIEVEVEKGPDALVDKGEFLFPEFYENQF